MTLEIGQSHTNLNHLKTTPLTHSSPIHSIVPKEVMDLMKINKDLEVSRVERLRAKVISNIIGGTLPFIITAIFALVIYQIYQAGVLAGLGQQLLAKLAAFAQQAFSVISSSGASLTASAGGALTVGYILSREPVYNAIGSFFGSLFGTISASSIICLFKTLHDDGYNWWNNQYHFDERIQSIDTNKKAIISQLTEVYNEMGVALVKASDDPHQNLTELRATAQLLEKRVVVIKEIFQKEGISLADADVITTGVLAGLGSVLDNKQI